MLLFNSNGVNIFYKDQGVGEPVVLIHGYLADNENQWETPGVVKALLKKNKYRVISLDSRGHGQSDKPLGPEKYGSTMPEDVARLLESLSIKKAHMVGYSMGSWIAQKFAEDHPNMAYTLTAGGAGLLGSDEIASVADLAATLHGIANNDPNAPAALNRFTQGVLATPTAAEAGPLRDAGLGVGTLAINNTYPGPTHGLIGKQDILFSKSMDNLQAQRVAKTLSFDKAPPVQGDHLHAFASTDFHESLTKFLGAHPFP